MVHEIPLTEIEQLRSTVESMQLMVATLAEQVGRLSTEVRTRRLVIVDDTGVERIVGECLRNAGDASLYVQTDTEHRASLVASPSSCCPMVGFSVSTGDEFPVMLFNECAHSLAVA